MSKIKKILGLVSVFLTLFVNAAFAGNKKFTLEENKNLELCRELNKIFAEPENAEMFEVYEDMLKRTSSPQEKLDPSLLGMYKYIFSTTEFTIPKKYKNFRLPIWQDITSEEFLQNVTPSKQLTSLIKDGKFTEFKKTKFDLDGDQKNEVMLKFNANTSDKHKEFWSCRVSEIEANVVSETYNKSHVGNDCFLFYYKGRAYQAETIVYDLMISEPSMLFNGGFIMTPVCTFNPK